MVAGKNSKGQFEKGNGFGKGRPKGSLNRMSFAHDLWCAIEINREALINKVMTLALEGDVACLKMMMDRLLPVSKYRYVEIDLPPADTLEGIKQGIEMLLGKMAKGEYSYDEIQPFVELYQAQSKAIENADIIPQINEIKQLMGKA